MLVPFGSSLVLIARLRELLTLEGKSYANPKINIKVVCLCPEEVTEQEYFEELLQEMLDAGIIRATASNTFAIMRYAEPEPQIVHHAFKPRGYRCQICRSTDILAHMWKG